MRTLLLFDIDGTLIWTTAGSRAFRATFADMYGLADAHKRVDFSGATDARIFRRALEAAGRPDDPLEPVFSHYIGALARELEKDPGEILPGVPRLLEACLRHEGWYLALGTGNVRGGAMAKLAAHGLDGYFPVGGFGEDGPPRDQVLAAGIQRSENHYGGPFDNVIVIGDTHHDIDAARLVGAGALAVATGIPSSEELAEARPDFLLPDFSDIEGTMEAFQHVISGDTADGPDGAVQSAQSPHLPDSSADERDKL